MSDTIHDALVYALQIAPDGHAEGIFRGALALLDATPASDAKIYKPSLAVPKQGGEG